MLHDILPAILGCARSHSSPEQTVAATKVLVAFIHSLEHKEDPESMEYKRLIRVYIPGIPFKAAPMLCFLRKPDHVASWEDLQLVPSSMPAGMRFRETLAVQLLYEEALVSLVQESQRAAKASRFIMKTIFTNEFAKRLFTWSKVIAGTMRISLPPETKLIATQFEYLLYCYLLDAWCMTDNAPKASFQQSLYASEASFQRSLHADHDLGGHLLACEVLRAVTFALFPVVSGFPGDMDDRLFRRLDELEANPTLFASLLVSGLSTAMLERRSLLDSSPLTTAQLRACIGRKDSYLRPRPQDYIIQDYIIQNGPRARVRYTCHKCGSVSVTKTDRPSSGNPRCGECHRDPPVRRSSHSPHQNSSEILYAESAASSMASMISLASRIKISAGNHTTSRSENSSTTMPIMTPESWDFSRVTGIPRDW